MSPSLWSAAPAAGLALGVLLGCESSEPQSATEVCRPGQFRGCPADCGGGVQQCFDTEAGPVWGWCSCIVSDAGFPPPQGGAAGTAGAAGAAAFAGSAGHGGLPGGGGTAPACGGASGAAGAGSPCAAGGASGDRGEGGGANASGAAGDGGETS